MASYEADLSGMKRQMYEHEHALRGIYIQKTLYKLSKVSVMV